MNNELLTINEVSKILRVDPTTVRRWIKRGAMEAVILPHVNARESYRVKQSTLNNVLSTPAVASNG